MLWLRRLALALVVAGLLIPCLATGGSSVTLFTISVAAPTAPKDVQLRYFVGNSPASFPTSTAIGGANKVTINGPGEIPAAANLKIIAYAPGCQFVTINVDDLLASNRQGEFQCTKLPTTQLQGRVSLSGLEGKELMVQALYVCNWSGQFFQTRQGGISPFVLTQAKVASDGTFSLELPDFSSDPLWSSLSNDASLSFQLVDSATGHSLNALTPPADLSQGNSLKVAASYPGEILFTAK